ncbi:MAG TPA: hypothetical protein VHV78_10215, partial [Gemmatimonadaceae bacterium]|nr:hypothetical protein [Gemmatimonadaceae bacterium]
ELIRLEPGKAVKDVAAFLYDTTAKGPPPLHAIGGVSGMAPGVTSYTEYDLVPGHYAMLCFAPAPDGKQHIEHGMVKEFTIQ